MPDDAPQAPISLPAGDTAIPESGELTDLLDDRDAWAIAAASIESRFHWSDRQPMQLTEDSSPVWREINMILRLLNDQYGRCTVSYDEWVRRVHEKEAAMREIGARWREAETTPQQATHPIVASGDPDEIMRNVFVLLLGSTVFGYRLERTPECEDAVISRTLIPYVHPDGFAEEITAHYSETLNMLNLYFERPGFISPYELDFDPVRHREAYSLLTRLPTRPERTRGISVTSVIATESLGPNTVPDRGGDIWDRSLDVLHRTTVERDRISRLFQRVPEQSREPFTALLTRFIMVCRSYIVNNDRIQLAMPSNQSGPHIRFQFNEDPTDLTLTLGDDHLTLVDWLRTFAQTVRLSELPRDVSLFLSNIDSFRDPNGNSIVQPVRQGESYIAGRNAFSEDRDRLHQEFAIWTDDLQLQFTEAVLDLCAYCRRRIAEGRPLQMIVQDTGSGPHVRYLASNGIIIEYGLRGTYLELITDLQTPRHSCNFNALPNDVARFLGNLDSFVNPDGTMVSGRNLTTAQTEYVVQDIGYRMEFFTSEESGAVVGNAAGLERVSFEGHQHGAQPTAEAMVNSNVPLGLYTNEQLDIMERRLATAQASPQRPILRANMRSIGQLLSGQPLLLLPSPSAEIERPERSVVMPRTSNA